MNELKYSDLFRSLAKQLDDNNDNISEVCDTLLEIVLAEMTLGDIISVVSSKYVEVSEWWKLTKY